MNFCVIKSDKVAILRCFLWQGELVAVISVPGSLALDCDRYERQKTYASF